MNIELAKAIYAAGFKAGRDAGMDEATARERGSYSHMTQDGDVAFKDDVEWRLLEPGHYHFDMEDPAGWRNL